MSEPLEAKVASIISDRELVLNKGSEDGVEIGMRFAVLLPNEFDIRDPDTNEVIGSVPLPKTFVKIVSMQEHIAKGRTFREFRTGGGGILASLSQGPTITHETISTDETLLLNELDWNERKVVLGDRARQIVGDEFIGGV